jgi:hypothetical protein
MKLALSTPLGYVLLDSYYYSYTTVITWLGLLSMSVFIGSMGIIGITNEWIKIAVTLHKAKFEAQPIP